MSKFVSLSLLLVLAALLLVVSVSAHSLNVGEKFLDDDEFEQYMDHILSDSMISKGQTVRATTGINVRSGPCTSKKIVGSMRAGQTAKYTGQTKSGCGYSWYSVNGSFGNGWVASKYVQVVGSGQKINQRGVDLVKSFEGWRSCKYRDPVGLWTIGYGHLIKKGEVFNKCLTRAEGESLLRRDLSSFEACVNRVVKVKLNSNQFSALTSFSYNVGCGALQGSTLLRLLNGGNYGSVCNELARWVKGGGRTLPGLVRRRKAECALFRS